MASGAATHGASKIPVLDSAATEIWLSGWLSLGSAQSSRSWSRPVLGKRTPPVKTSAQEQRLAECLLVLVPFWGQFPALLLRPRLRAVDNVLLPSPTHSLCALRVLPCVWQDADFAWRGWERRNGAWIAAATAANHETGGEKRPADYTESHSNTSGQHSTNQSRPAARRVRQAPQHR